jgi:hypothetical protein
MLQLRSVSNRQLIATAARNGLWMSHPKTAGDADQTAAGQVLPHSFPGRVGEAKAGLGRGEDKRSRSEDELPSTRPFTSRPAFSNSQASRLS